MVITILATILVLGILILVHELGHFWAAKAVDIEVQRFSIGFGPRLLSVTRGETEYILAAVPFGGYVKMAGMDEEEALAPLEGPAERGRQASPRDFDAKPLWARALVISAGVVMNVVFAFFVFTVLARAHGVVTPVIGEVQPESPAALAGLRPGDRILAVEGQPVREFSDLVLAVEPRAGEPLELRVEREGRELAFRLRPDSVRIWNSVAKDSVWIGRIGIAGDVQAGHRPLGWRNAAVEGFYRTGYWTRAIVRFAWELISGRTSAKELGGPILIGQLSGEFARAGIWPLLNFMAIISINLAVLNLLPIPVLDGGHLLFLGVEAVRGRALSTEQRVRLTQIGLVFIVLLMVLAFANDLLRILS